MPDLADLIIVGGGAAGLWAAGTAAERGLSVVVLEKNRKLGVKILMSGGTRCNLTQHCDASGIVRAFDQRQGRFLKHSVYALPPASVVNVVEQLGVPTKVESTGKVFPASDRAIDVRDALVRRAQSVGVEFCAGVTVTQIAREKGDWQVDATTLEKGDSESITLHGRQLLLCSGGLSYPGCGTTGDGYSWVEQLGHSLTATAPALTPLLSPERWVHELTGLTLADVEARIRLCSTDSKMKKSPRMICRGGFLWTHFGCSGPVPMNLSRFVSARSSQGKAPSFELLVDLVPDVSAEYLAREFETSGSDHAHNKRQLNTILQAFVPKSLAATLLQRAQIAGSCPLAELPRRSRIQLLNDLKGLAVPISGTRGYAKAEVTQGGISLQEVHPKTMESRLVPTLYFAGEILDIDGPIGGYNFQAAFSTGHAAGLAVKKQAELASSS